MIAAQKYTIKIYDSMSDFIHGNPTTITDFYIPSINITFNYHDNKLNVFEGCRTKEGSDILDVEIDQDVVDNVIRIQSRKNEIDMLSKNIIEFIKK